MTGRADNTYCVQSQALSENANMAIIIPFPAPKSISKTTTDPGASHKARLSGVRVRTFRQGDDPLNAKFEFRPPVPVSTDSLGCGIYNVPEAVAIREFFYSFGIAIEPRAYTTAGLISAFAWLQGSIKARALARLADPEVYSILYSPVSPGELDYLDALLAKNHAAAAEALPKTPFVWQLLTCLGAQATSKRV